MRLSFTYDHTNCPTLEELTQYRQQKLSVEESEDIEFHLAWCRLCMVKEAYLDPGARPNQNAIR